MSSAPLPLAWEPSLAHESEPAAVRLEALLDRAEKVLARGLSLDELRELARLYRGQAARLARLRDLEADPDEVHYLNALCVRAYAFLYSNAAPRGRRSRRTLGQLAQALTESLRQAAIYGAGAVVIAWILLGIGAGIGAALVVKDPDALYVLLPVAFGYSPDVADRLWSSSEARERFLLREETPAAENALFGSFLFTHNTQVGILSFATGMLAGIPTVVLQLYNGLTLGAFGAIFLRDAQALAFLAWILPHGVPELTAITLCSAAGLMLGAAIAAPGRRGRPRALRDASGVALALFGAAVPLFLVAALTESFVRESALGTAPRLAIAGLYGLLLLLAAFALARLRSTRPDAPRWLDELARR